MTGPYFLRHLETGANSLPRSLCLGALPLLYPAAPPSVFAFDKYTAPAVALVREVSAMLRAVFVEIRACRACASPSQPQSAALTAPFRGMRPEPPAVDSLLLQFTIL